MHPFWLTFGNGELERQFQSGQREARLPTDKICTLSLLAYELAILYRYYSFDSVWPSMLLLRCVVVIAPLSLLSWCHLTFKGRDLLALQPALAISVKVLYAPFIPFFLEYTSLPDKAAVDYYEAYEPRPLLLAFGIALAVGITGSCIPAMFSTMGMRVDFKRQFYILLVGIPCRFWWTHKEVARLSRLRPSGIRHMDALSEIIDACSNVVLHFTHSSTQHRPPSPHRSEQIIAFVNFYGIGVLCLVWLWWCELLDRERFLKRLVSDRLHDRHVKALVYKESRLFRSGLDVNAWGADPCFLLMYFVAMSCVGAIVWTSISFFFGLFAHGQGGEMINN